MREVVGLGFGVDTSREAGTQATDAHGVARQGPPWREARRRVGAATGRVLVSAPAALVVMAALAAVDGALVPNYFGSGWDGAWASALIACVVFSPWALLAGLVHVVSRRWLTRIGAAVAGGAGMALGAFFELDNYGYHLVFRPDCWKPLAAAVCSMPVLHRLDRPRSPSASAPGPQESP